MDRRQAEEVGEGRDSKAGRRLVAKQMNPSNRQKKKLKESDRRARAFAQQNAAKKRKGTERSKQYLILGVASIKEAILICLSAAVAALAFYVFHLVIDEMPLPY